LFRSICERLRARADNPFFQEVAGRPPARRYLIATTARTGSTLLCSRIAEYGDLGFPNEFLNESYITEFDRLFPNPSLQDFERYVSHAFTSKTGLFGLKTDWWRFWIAQESQLLRSFYEPLDLVVWLKREDFVAQAISLALAQATHVWHVRDDGDGALQARHAEAAFDARAIIEQVRNIMNQEYYWRLYFERTDAPRVDLTYEGLARNADDGVQAIADAFKLSFKRRRSEPHLRKGVSGIAETWRTRFEDECADFVAFWAEHRGLISASS
jgi:LPS sulfotransferase NodH